MARSLIACLLLLVVAAPAQAALVMLDRDQGDGIVWQAAAMPGAAEFNRLSRPMPVRFDFSEAVRQQEPALVDLAGDGAAAWPPRAFRPAEDAIALSEGPGQAGWVPLVGGLALVAYRIRRGNRRFRFRSAV